MFSMPNKALAETCEADKSFFTMPILLAVALIGATVGGKVVRFLCTIILACDPCFLFQGLGEWNFVLLQDD